jgi:O-antigen/teichoic acid export membrane protein
MAVIFNTALFRVDSTLLSLMKGNADVGIYGAAYRLLESTLFISWIFVSALLPTLSRLSPTTSPTIGAAWEVGAKLIVTALLPVGTCFVLFAEPIVDLVYSTGYEEAVGALRLLGVAACCYGITYLASYVLIAQGREIVLPWATAAVLVVNVALNLVFIPPYSYDGAAAVTSFSEALLAAVFVFYARRVAGTISLRRIVTGPLAGCAAIVAVAAVAGTSLAAALLGALVYPVVLLAAERRLFPGDVRMLIDAVRRRTPAVDVRAEPR